jgi:hypothetical protein
MILDDSTLRSILLNLVDRGVLGLLLLLAGYLVNRAIEKLKVALSWHTEILKQRMSVARELLEAFKHLQETHLTLVFNRVFGRFDMELFETSRQKFLSQSQASQLLFSTRFLAALGEVQYAYEAFLSSSPPPFEGEEPIELDLGIMTPAQTKWTDTYRQNLKKAIENAIDQMRRQFPSEVKL